MKDQNGMFTFIWSGISSNFSRDIQDIGESSEYIEAERGDTISEEFLLKVLAIAKQPDLIKDVNGN